MKGAHQCVNLVLQFAHIVKNKKYPPEKLKLHGNSSQQEQGNRTLKQIPAYTETVVTTDTTNIGQFLYMCFMLI